jgi:hypothetical protein
MVIPLIWIAGAMVSLILVSWVLFLFPGKVPPAEDPIWILAVLFWFYFIPALIGEGAGVLLGKALNRLSRRNRS